MEISKTELRKYLTELGINGSYTEDDLAQLREEVQARIDRELQSSLITSNSHPFYNSQFLRTEEKVFRPAKANTDENRQRPANYMMNDNINDFQEFQKPLDVASRLYNSRAEQPQSDYQQLEQQFRQNEVMRNDQQLFDDAPKKSKEERNETQVQKTLQQRKQQEQEQIKQENLHELRQKDAVDLDQLADQIIGAGTYKKTINQRPNIRIVRQSTQNVEDNNQIDIDQQNAVQAAIARQQNLMNEALSQHSQQYTEGDADLQQDHLDSHQVYLQRVADYKRKMESGVIGNQFHKQEHDQQCIYKYIGPHRDTRQQQIFKRADLLDRVNYYKQCWSIQGDPGDRKKRILNAKASKMVNKVLSKRDIEREAELRQKYQEFEKWKLQQQMQGQ